MIKDLISELRLLRRMCLDNISVLERDNDCLILFHIGECTGKMTEAIDRSFFVYDELSLSQYNTLRKWLNAFVYDKIEIMVNFKYKNRL